MVKHCAKKSLPKPQLGFNAAGRGRGGLVVAAERCLRKQGAAGSQASGEAGWAKVRGAQ